MSPEVNVEVNSEVGVLEAVMVHTPGPEVENMTPESAERALYSDILNLSRVRREYDQFHGLLKKFTKVYEVKDLLADVLENGEVRDELIEIISAGPGGGDVRAALREASPVEMATLIFEGVPMVKDNLTKFLDKDRYALQPLHNFFFMRDAAASIGGSVFISRMASQVREREARVMKAIFSHHPGIKGGLLNPGPKEATPPEVCIEGGDILVARDDLLLVGQGDRTSTQGVDYLIEVMKKREKPCDIIVQELPYGIESFIHLDMVFTLLDRNSCMVFEPLILKSSRYLAIHIHIEKGKVQITEEPNLLTALKKQGMDLEPVKCGGSDSYTQEREQWHSGANFFCLGPGKVMAYGRNTATLDELANHGYEVVPAPEAEAEKIDLADGKRMAFTIDGAELARGGGGCRCMTMPLRRASL